jgi:hypothetical protein
MARTGSAPPPPADSLELRLAVFEHLDALIDEYGPSIPRAALETGRFYFGQTLRLIEPRRAILKPAGWDTVLTVTTNLGSTSGVATRMSSMRPGACTTPS